MDLIAADGKKKNGSTVECSSAKIIRISVMNGHGNVANCLFPMLLCTPEKSVQLAAWRGMAGVWGDSRNVL
jgi:hypothetical protein